MASPPKKKWAKGSTKTWGGWETRSCWHCHQRIVLSRGSALHCNPAGGQPFSICDRCFGNYSAAWKANAPTERPNPDQLALEDVLW